jgi:hypothetical protein
MTRLVLAALVAQLAACEEPSEMLPLNPGGGGGTGSQFRPDAAIGEGEGDAGALISGRVCYVLANLQTTPGTCAPEQGDFVVQLGSAMTTTALDGSFTIMRPANTTGLFWSVTRLGDVVPSAIKFGATTTLPVLDTLAYQDMLAAMQPVLGPTFGALMVRVTRAGTPVTGATVDVPASDSGTYYDGQDDLAWETDATHGFGVAWIPSAPVGPTQITITSGTTPTVITGQSVFANTVTFVFAELP